MGERGSLGRELGFDLRVPSAPKPGLLNALQPPLRPSQQARHQAVSSHTTGAQRKRERYPVPHEYPGETRACYTL